MLIKQDILRRQELRTAYIHNRMNISFGNLKCVTLARFEVLDMIIVPVECIRLYQFPI